MASNLSPSSLSTLQNDLNAELARDAEDASQNRRRESIATTTDEEGDDTSDDAKTTQRSVRLSKKLFGKLMKKMFIQLLFSIPFCPPPISVSGVALPRGTCSRSHYGEIDKMSP